ncbi:Uncharacterised protein [Raoultella terrigena]|uniref:Uncharacterized protein n=1 Tax=Raoultella terrigena TaxID=577 RepID=A0A3P8KP69_RAOTE|nr:Uncharacterised protein [Raoultella terrigena]
MNLEIGSPRRGSRWLSGNVLQEFAQARARRVLNQNLRIAIFRNTPFVDED